MKNIFQIYKKCPNENTFEDAGFNNRFWDEDKANARCEELNRTWQYLGYEYIIVKVR